jgi:hypothetical protein
MSDNVVSNKARKSAFLFALMLAGMLLTGIPASAQLPGPGVSAALPYGAAVSVQPMADPQAEDGFNKLPLGMQARSMSSLVSLGLVDPQPLNAQVDQSARYNNPLSPITWGAERDTSIGSASNEPAAVMHPTDGNYALTAGNSSACANTRIGNTTDGGNTWTTRCAPQSDSSGDGVVT